MFFFSNRLGCVGSLVLSAAITVVFFWGSPLLKPTGPHAKMPLGLQVRYQSPEQSLAVDNYARTTASQEQ